MDDMSAKIQEILSDKESMQQLSELAEMFSAGQNTQNESNPQDENTSDNSQGNPFEGFDISMIFKLQEIMSKTSEDETANLLVALKPLLSEKRKHKVDKAVKILRLLSVWEILKESGLMNDFFKWGD